MKIIVINGPNLNVLKNRDKSIYGDLDIDNINSKLKAEYTSVEFDFFQTNLEGEIINLIQAAEEKYNAIIINPGGYAHTSVAIKDALEICSLIKIEVHLSNIAAREEYRKTTLTAGSCTGYISGFKENSYFAAVDIIKRMIK